LSLPSASWRLIGKKNYQIKMQSDIEKVQDSLGSIFVDLQSPVCRCSSFSSDVTMNGTLNGVSIQTDPSLHGAIVQGVNLQTLSNEALRKTGDQELFGKLRVAGLGLAAGSDADANWGLNIDQGGNVAWTKTDLLGDSPACHSSATFIITNAEKQYVDGCYAWSGTAFDSAHFTRVTASGAIAAPIIHVSHNNRTGQWRIGLESIVERAEEMHQLSLVKSWPPYHFSFFIPGVYAGKNKWEAGVNEDTSYTVSPVDWSQNVTVERFQYHDFKQVYSSSTINAWPPSMPPTTGWSGGVKLQYI